MQKTEQYYKQKIAEEIKRILNLEQNKQAAQTFWQTLENIKPKSCVVKIGWRSGDSIDFLLAYEKNGNKEAFNLFIENISDSIETYGFIMGLAPDIFHIKYGKVIKDETHCFIDIRLKKNG